MIEKIPFGVMPDSTLVEQYTLRAGALSCDIITYGGALRALQVPDRNGKPVDVTGSRINIWAHWLDGWRTGSVEDGV